MSYHIFNSTLPIVRTEIDNFVKNFSLSHPYQKALSIPYFREKLVTKVLNTIPNNHILIDQCHPFIEDDFFYIELATEKQRINDQINIIIPDIVKEYNDFISTPNKLICPKKNKVHHSKKSSWWLRFDTEKPTAIYYFGPFDSFGEAADNSQGYLEDLIGEKANNISYDIEFGSPHQLTTINDLQDLQQENDLILRELWQNKLENQYYKNLFFNSPDIRLILDDNLNIKSLNYQGMKLFNLLANNIENQNFSSFIVSDNVEKFLSVIQNLREDNFNQNDNFLSLKLSLPNESLINVSLKISKILDSNNKINGWNLSFHDITEIQRNHDQFYYQSRYDCLTNLPNRLSLLEFLQNILTEAEKSHSNKFAVLYLDIDKFKSINDTFGHQIGDEVLIIFAKRLMTCVRNFDHVARLSGDEFMIVLSHIHSVQEATECAHRIQQILSTCFKINQIEIMVKVSIGIVIGDIKSSNVSDLLSHADMAMYKAKYSEQLFSIYHC